VFRLISDAFVLVKNWARIISILHRKINRQAKLINCYVKQAVKITRFALFTSTAIIVIQAYGILWPGCIYTASQEFRPVAVGLTEACFSIETQDPCHAVGLPKRSGHFTVFIKTKI
jgi:hypothetical protein